MRILYYGETPCIETGAARVSKHVLATLHAMGHEIAVVGLNHPFDTYDKALYPYTIYRAPSDELYNLVEANRHIKEDEYDLLFLMGDVNIIDECMETVIARKDEKNFPLIVYAAIDADTMTPNYMRCFTIAEYPLVYSQYAKSVAVKYNPLLEDRIQVITLGCEPDVFYPLPEEKRQEIRKRVFSCEPDTFLVVNVNRNQLRKDMGRSSMAFHQFHQQCPNSKLYLHAKQTDVGGCLPFQAHLFGMTLTGPDTEVIFAPNDFHEMSGIDRTLLNELYNAADVLLSTSTGEAWGLTTTEAMSAGTPVIVPHNTAFIELVGHEERGYFIKSGGPDLWYIPYGISDGPRPLCSVVDAVRQLENVYTDREEAKQKAHHARMWALEHTWGHTVEQWEALFNSIIREEVTV